MLSHLTAAQIQEARKTVAWDLIRNAHAIRDENAYASHVTQETKEQIFRDSLNYAAEVEQGKHDGCFTIAQRIVYAATGVCVPFLPPSEPSTTKPSPSARPVRARARRGMA